MPNKDREKLKTAMALYGVTDRRWLGKACLKDHVEASLKGGVTFLQLREKDLSEEAFIKEAEALKALCQRYEVPFVINDNIAVAQAVDADGVHVGQSDMAMTAARAALGEDKIIGVSVQSVAQALAAEAAGADYLGVGAVFATSTKTDAADVAYDLLQEICNSVTIPVVAIGGIGPRNLHKLSGSGIDGVAVVSAIYASEDIEGAARCLLKSVETIIKA